MKSWIKAVHPAVGIAVAVTIVWAVFVCWLFLHSESCVTPSFLLDPPLSKLDWWTSHVACLKPNEVGDVLAGAVAPLAFLWFVATVFMQNREMADNRAVMIEQAQAMADQVAVSKTAAQASHTLLLWERNLALFEECGQALWLPEPKKTMIELRKLKVQANRLGLEDVATLLSTCIPLADEYYICFTSVNRANARRQSNGGEWVKQADEEEVLMKGERQNAIEREFASIAKGGQLETAFGAHLNIRAELFPDAPER